MNYMNELFKAFTTDEQGERYSKEEWAKAALCALILFGCCIVL